MQQGSDEMLSVLILSTCIRNCIRPFFESVSYSLYEFSFCGNKIIWTYKEYARLSSQLRVDGAKGKHVQLKAKQS